MTDFTLPFDLSDFRRLDEFALLACQSYNLGDKNDWFGAFRGGLHGFYARIHGVVIHYLTVHAWIPAPRNPIETEYHLASMLFNMDSAIECLTFAMNSLGYAALPCEFRDISNERELKKISPKDILGDPSAAKSRSVVPGYALLFPTLQSFWQSNRKLLSIVVEQHDVSKHRETIYDGGMARLDTPPGFYEQLGVGDDPAVRSMFWPMAEIILRKDPKSVRAGRTPQEVADFVLLETVASDYCQFVNNSGKCVLQDVFEHIKLAHSEFIRDVSDGH